MPSTVGIVASGEDVLNDAVFWVDAGRSSVVSGALSNLGTGGSALNARFGNSTGVDSFDPALLTHTGTNYLYLPGTSTADNVTAPSISAYNITGDLEVEVDIAFTTLTPASSTYMLAREGADPNRAWSFFLTSGGLLGIRWYPTGSSASQVFKTSTATLASAGITAGQRISVKVTLDVDNGASGNDVKFWYSTNSGVSFTQLGTTVTTAGVASLPTVTQALFFNTSLGGTNLDAKLYRGIVRNGIGGTTVFDANFTTGITSGGQTTFTESSANAATVTINRSTSGRKAVAVTRPILLFGTDDYLEVPDNDLLDFGATDSFTVVAVVRQWATPTSFSRIIDKSNTTDTGWSIQNSGTSSAIWTSIDDGPNQQSRNGLSTYTIGALRASGMITNRSNQTLISFTNTTLSASASTSSVGSLVNALPMRIGSNAAGAGGAYSDFELVAAAVWRRALNANEIATIVARYT